MTRRILVCNGDADGLCAAQQLKLSGFAADEVVTGVKRDIALLARVAPAPGLEVAVADLSLAANRAAVPGLLAAGARIVWYDHHEAGTIPSHAGFTAHIDQDPLICTSLIVDRVLGGRFATWAVAAAYGDNLHVSAAARGRAAGLSDADLALLRELGELVNYNAYGESEGDLHVRPAALLASFGAEVDARRFARESALVPRLRAGWAADLAAARAVLPRAVGAGARLVKLPRAAWARRVGGVYANELARAAPALAHAVLTGAEGGYVVSVRAPLARPGGAAALCGQFAGGGGREAAAGINLLAEDEVEHFVAALGRAYG